MSSKAYDLQGLINSMMDGDPFFKQMMQTYKAAFLVFQHVFSKIKKFTIKNNYLNKNYKKSTKHTALRIKSKSGCL
jgi:hypothetical protein